MKAELLIRERVVYPDGALAEMVVWRVHRPTAPSRHRFKYSLVYIVSGRRMLGYDNERGKGDHRHFADREEAFVFSSIEELLARFTAEVESMRKSE
jgi:Family of unknown function (DUF6516)